jgi:hypothetical protein
MYLSSFVSLLLLAGIRKRIKGDARTMKKFLLLYLSPVSAEQQMQTASPEDMQKGMEPWVRWFDANKQAMVEMGTPTGNEMNVTKAGSSRPTTFIGGYSIVQADDLDAVQAILSDHPHYMMEGNTIEVLELMPMPGM